MTGASLIPQLTVLEVPLSLFLLQMAVILTTCKGLSILGGYFDQPAVVFEIIGGVLLGPSAFGKIPAYKEAIFPEYSLETLNVVANFGLQLYLFLVGLELDLAILIDHSIITTAIAMSGIVVPFGVGLEISTLLYNLYMPNVVDGTRANYITFAVFIGTAMAVTALPVLVRILKEQNLMYTRPGFIALGAAVITDAIAWILLVVAISLANSKDTAIAGWTFLAIILYAIIAFTLGKWTLRLLVHNVERWSTSDAIMKNLLTLIVVLVMLSAVLVAQLGVDPIVGSFLLGVVIPRHTQLYRYCVNTLENFVLVIFLPLFFAISGLRTDVTKLKPYPDLLVLLLICAGATLGKYFGVCFAACISGMPWQESCVLATLMNTRGLVELIVLNIGRSFSVLDGRIFSILVLMCLFTTFATCPILHFLYPIHARKYLKDSVSEALDGDLEVCRAADHIHSHSSGCTAAHEGENENDDDKSAGNGNLDSDAECTEDNDECESGNLRRESVRSFRFSYDVDNLEGEVKYNETSSTGTRCTPREAGLESPRNRADNCSDFTIEDLLELCDIEMNTR